MTGGGSPLASNPGDESERDNYTVYLVSTSTDLPSLLEAAAELVAQTRRRAGEELEVARFLSLVTELASFGAAASFLSKLPFLINH